MKKKNIIWSYSKEELENIFNNSDSLSNFMKNIGILNYSGSVSEDVKKCLEFNGINWKKLTYTGIHYSKNKLMGKRILSNDEIFVINSNVSRGTLKRRIIKDNLLNYKCSVCGLLPIWNNKELPLILDHINGINNDNRLENLRFVCPNCNYQLETTCRNHNRDKNYDYTLQEEVIRQHNKISENKQVISKHGDIYYVCPICGGKKSRTSKMCRSCSEKQRTKKYSNISNISRDALLQDILDYPICKISKKYSVSDATIRKWLKKNNLPYTKKEIQKLRLHSSMDRA